MAKRWMAGAVIGGCLLLTTAARAQELGFPPGPGGPGGWGDTIPADGPTARNCSMALHDPPKDKPNAFCGEHECPKEPCCESFFGFGAEFLLWHIKDGPLPVPLVTTTSTPAAGAVGAIGQPGTTVLFGNRDLSYDELSGGRLTGIWAPNDSMYIEARGFILGDHHANFAAQSDAAGLPVLARPIFATNLGMNTAALVSFPGAATGSVAVTSSSQLWGAEANAVFNAYADDNLSIGVLAGFRYLDLNEDLNIFSSSTLLAPATLGGLVLPAGAGFSVADFFRTHDRFYGVQPGVRVEYTWGNLSVAGDAKIGLGETHRVLEVHGSTSFPGAGVTLPAGLLALPSNSGLFGNNHFSAVPELSVNVGYELTDGIRVFAGYNFLYWTNVVRPGEQINDRIDTRQVPASTSFTPGLKVTEPTPLFRQSDFWAQGVNIGLVLGF